MLRKGKTKHVMPGYPIGRSGVALPFYVLSRRATEGKREDETSRRGGFKAPQKNKMAAGATLPMEFKKTNVSLQDSGKGKK